MSVPRAYYNEHEPYAAQWLRNLIANGHLMAGDVDERDIQDVQPDDLRGYIRCHFFAGIGGWDYALRLAGWGDGPIWTGSCPCQPFSSAGKGAGFDDPRHLWPVWLRLIRECRPATILGEQTANKAGLGWFDTVATDLEDEAYAVGASDLPAACVEAVILRQRLWFVAESAREGSRRLLLQPRRPQREDVDAQWSGEAGGMAGPTSERRERPRGEREPHGGPTSQSGRLRAAGLMGGADSPRLETRGTLTEGTDWWDTGRASEPASQIARPWRDAEWIPCTDGFSRAAQPGIFPLAPRLPGRVGQLRASGNSIVPQVAAEFVAAYLDLTRPA